MSNLNKILICILFVGVELLALFWTSESRIGSRVELGWSSLILLTVFIGWLILVVS